jgi:2-oxo-4-hydroxy-4-carboxy-5-ureidoimidazoline decarboxylase
MAHVTLDELNGMDRPGFVAALGDIFEHSPWIAEAACAARPFSSLDALYRTMTNAVREAGQDRQVALIAAHPDLAGKAAHEGMLTADSTHEQASAGLDRLSEEEFVNFHRLNAAYRAKFALPLVVCVRRHGKDSILRQFERRLANESAAERQTALNEIFRIAALRLDRRVVASDRLKVHGRLSTHVLDTQCGCPADGVAVELFEVQSAGRSRPIASAVTNADGRTERPLLADQPIPIAEYELRFDIGAYFTRQGVATADPPFLGLVPIRFSVAEPEAHYHVPLLATPWSYSTYRGS